MKVLKKFLLTTIALTSINAFAETKVGIIIPMEHQAMTEIVEGFTKTLQKKYNEPITFKISNAQNDQNLEHAIMQQMRDGDYNLIVTISTHAGEMAAKTISKKPVIALAADISDESRKKLSPCNVAIVDDEIETSKIMDFIHDAYPNLQNITLIHSNSEKILPEVKEAVSSAQKIGINVKSISIQNLMDLQNLAHNLPQKTEAIFILKDSLVVNGISQLANIAKQKNIPLITSDQGSIKKGAGFSIGVKEKQIGVNGAKLALDILKGKKACDIPIKKMNHLFVFINPNALQDTAPIIASAKKLKYKVVNIH